MNQKFIIICLSLFFIAGCGTKHTAFYARNAQSNVPKKNTGGYYKVGSEYTINGKKYKPREYDQYTAVGVASWYGGNDHNKMTANGELFNKYDFSAAHKTLPLPSVVRVTNLENNNTIIVKVNDRGPFADERLIDMSESAAKALGFHKKGLVLVKVEYLKPESKKLIQELKSGKKASPTFVYASYEKPQPDEHSNHAGNKPTLNDSQKVGAKKNKGQTSTKSTLPKKAQPILVSANSKPAANKNLSTNTTKIKNPSLSVAASNSQQKKHLDKNLGFNNTTLSAVKSKLIPTKKTTEKGQNISAAKVGTATPQKSSGENNVGNIQSGTKIDTAKSQLTPAEKTTEKGQNVSIAKVSTAKPQKSSGENNVGNIQSGTKIDTAKSQLAPAEKPIKKEQNAPTTKVGPVKSQGYKTTKKNSSPTENTQAGAGATKPKFIKKFNLKAGDTPKNNK